MTDYYVAFRYVAGTGKEELKRITEFMEHYSSVYPVHVKEQPVLTTELNNQELIRADFHEAFVFENETTAKLIARIVPRLNSFAFIDDVVVGEAEWANKS
jgi:hypothetical protein